MLDFFLAGEPDDDRFLERLFRLRDGLRRSVGFRGGLRLLEGLRRLGGLRLLEGLRRLGGLRLLEGLRRLGLRRLLERERPMYPVYQRPGDLAT